MARLVTIKREILNNKVKSLELKILALKKAQMLVEQGKLLEAIALTNQNK